MIIVEASEMFCCFSWKHRLVIQMINNVLLLELHSVTKTVADIVSSHSWNGASVFFT